MLFEFTKSNTTDGTFPTPCCGVGSTIRTRQVVTNKQSVIKGDLIAVIAKAAVDKGVAARYDDEWDILQWIASIGNIQNNGTF
jgi:hypothetical protein